MKKWFYIALTLLTPGCTDDVELRLPDYEPKLVIDGFIEQDRYAFVALTKSAEFFKDISKEDLQRASVISAKVTISDGERAEVLTLRRNSRGFPPLAYHGTEILGEVGKTYTLTIENENKVYTATTTIMPPPEFDSLWFEADDAEVERYILRGTFTDDPDQVNYYRTFTQRKNIDSHPVPVYLSALGDRFFNGKTLTIDLLRGANNFNQIESDIYFDKDDTVLVKFCSMDQAHFDFWRTLEREVYATGNPFSSSGNEIIFNTSEGAMGIWGGYGASYYVLVVN